MLGSLGTDIQNIANKVKTSIESKLSTTFKTFDVVKSEPPYDPTHSSYRMEVLTDDNGVVRVKTVRKESGQEWESYVEQYDKVGAVTGIGGGPNSTSTLTTKGKITQGLKELADRIRTDIESSLGKTFQTYNVVSSEPEYAPEHASYRLEVQTDNEGIVTVKTVKKENGQEWQTSVESYDHGKKVEAGAQGTSASQTASQVAGQVGQAADQAASKVGQAADQASHSASQTASQVAGQVGQAADQAASKVGQAASQVSQSVDNAAEQAATKVGQAANQVGQAAGQAASNVTYSAEQLAESMKNLHLKVKNDLEKSLNKQYNTFNVVSHDPPFHPEHTSYRLEVQTDDQGHVKVTTVKKEDGTEWTTSVAEYDNGNLVAGSQAAQ